MTNRRGMLSQFTSDKIRFWSFVSMTSLVVVHGYNLHARHLGPSTLPAEALTFSTFAEYFLANGILRFRLPLLCLISGYLYALHDHAPNHERIMKRVRSLVVPYLLWSGICLLLFYGLENFSVTREWIGASQVARMHGTRLLVHEYRWYDVLARWILTPLPYQLWFLRVLFFYNLAYPVLARWVDGSTSKRVFFPVAIVLWLGSASLFLFEGETLLFFSLGVWMQSSGFDIDEPSRCLNPRWWSLVFVGAAATKTYLAFDGVAMLGGGVQPVLLVLHKLTTVSGVVSTWYGCDALVRGCMSRRWFAWLAPFSFVIFAVHAPWIAILIDPVLAWLDPAPGARILTFAILPLTIIALAIGVGAALRAVAPQLYGVLTGGRGLSPT